MKIGLTVTGNMILRRNACHRVRRLAEAQAQFADCIRSVSPSSLVMNDPSMTGRMHNLWLPLQGKKAGKLEDGMAEAQAQAAGCIRLLSLSDLVKVDLMAAGAVRFLTPLLESKLNQARWNARQVSSCSQPVGSFS